MREGVAGSLGPGDSCSRFVWGNRSCISIDQVVREAHTGFPVLHPERWGPAPPRSEARPASAPLG